MSCSLIGETQDILIEPSSLAYDIYKTDRATERFNCNYSLNERYKNRLQKSDLQCVGFNTDGAVRIVELPRPQFFLAMLFQPQLNLNDTSVHPVILEYLSAANAFAKN